jgi:hypothetical protein
MPNWCNNGLTLEHKDSAMVQRAYDALREGRFLQEFIPCPQDLIDTVSGFVGEGQAALEAKQASNREKYNYATWYDYNVNEWGTKWDVGGDDGLMEMINPNTLQASFESAWAPPVAAYEKLCAMGFIIKAFYEEPGMAFCGMVTGDEDGFDDEYYEYGGETSETVRDVIGEELDDYFGISEQMADWEAENEENIDIDLDGGVSAVNEQEQNENK